MELGTVPEALPCRRHRRGPRRPAREENRMKRTYRTSTALVASLSLMMPYGNAVAQAQGAAGQADGAGPLVCLDGAVPPCAQDPQTGTPLLDLPAEVALPLRIPDIAEARLSTGANVVSGEAYGLIDADMVEMETFAVLRACQRFGVPLVSLRGISDGKEDVNHVDDWTEYLHVIDEKLADAVDRLCRAIEDGVIAL